MKPFTQPPLVVPSHVEIADARHRTLANGASIHTLRSDDFEVVRFTFVFRAGSRHQTRPFCASATANLLGEGSRDMDARRIAEQLDYHGSYFDVNIDRDYAYVSFCCLEKFFFPTLAVAEQVLLHPLFPDDELRTYCAKRRQRLAIERAKVDIRAREAFAEALFGEEHPYGVAAPEAAYDTLTRDDVVDFHRRCYTARRAFVVCSGHITDALAERIAALAERLPAGDDTPDPALPAAVRTPLRFVPHEGAVQSSIRIGRPLFTRDHPDFVGMQVVAAALGGYFGSRLMQNLRERNGYTYGVMAAMVNLQHAGYLAVATQVGREVTHDALREIRREIARLRDEPMPAEELELVRNILTGEMMRILDGPFGVADVTIENLLCGFENRILNDNLRRIRTITPAEVQRLAARYLRDEALVTVVAGDPSLAPIG